jgi:hypothetical protein
MDQRLTEIYFSPIEKLPSEMLLSIVTNLTVDQTLNLCHTNKALLNFCQNWKQMLTLKYPGVNWSETSQENAIEIDRNLEKKFNNFKLIWATENGYLTAVKYLLEVSSGYDNGFSIKYAIRIAAKEGHLDIVEYLMTLLQEHIIYLTANNAIITAAKAGQLNVIEYLLSLPKEYGIDPSAWDNMAIIWAASYGHLDVIKYLMSLPREYGINPAAQDNEAIKTARKEGYFDIVEYFMSLPREYGIEVI